MTPDSDCSHPLDAARLDPARLAAVERSGLLDSAPEPAFDALTRMAAALLKVPASFVSIVDARRDFYKSQTGFPAELARTRELAGPTFCHHALGRDDALVIGDTHADPVWRAVPTVQTLGVRAYAGVPLEVGGQTMGSFCVIDQQPRAWSAEELAVLEQLALSAEREIGLRIALADAHAATARALESVRAKEQIVAAVAHDLRTPLQVIALSAEALRQASSAAPRAVARIGSATASMARMVDELLKSHDTLPSAPPAPHTAIGAARLLADVHDTMAPIAARAGVELAVADAPDAPLAVDYAQMLRVFCNLVGNAIKFSAHGSRITLAAAHDGARVDLRVTDQGCGIDGPELARVFERGWQGRDGRVRGGSGLGLSIVKDLVERHGGAVRIESTPGVGTTVCVSLPLAQR